MLSKHHHAYRGRHSTTTALMEITDLIYRGADANEIIATLSVDQSAAFDCVVHRTLIEKLEMYGLDQHSLRWINSYLTDRSAYVAIGSAASRIHSTPFGVPQGSVLGPLLYLCYVNDFPAVVEKDECSNEQHKDNTKLFGGDCEICGTLPVFADDGLYVISGKSRFGNQLKIEEMFIRIRDFLNSNGLELNESKTGLTEFMVCQKRTRMRGIPPELTAAEKIEENGRIKFLDKHITDKSQIKILGLVLKNNLSWEAHLVGKTKPLLPAVRRIVGMLSRLRNVLSRRARLQLANALVVSKISYAISIWGHTSENYILKAQTSLNMAARFVSGMNKRTSKRILMKSCNWLDIDQLRAQSTLLHVWKTVNWNVPCYMRELITIEPNLMIATSIPRLQIVENSFRCESVRLWNLLPDLLRQETNLGRFKSGMRKWLIEGGMFEVGND